MIGLISLAKAVSEFASDQLIADRCLHDRLRGSAGPILGRRPEVSVGVERRRSFGVAEGSLDGDDIAACGDEARRIEVPEVVQLDAAQPGGVQRLAPPVADTVLVHRPTTLAEKPLLVADCADLSDVLGDEIDQTVGQVDYSL